MKLNNILGQSAFWQVNKYLARHFKNNDTALLLSDLISKQEYFEEKGQLTNDGFFFNTAENIESDTNISYHNQKKCLKQLNDEGFVISKLKGVPAKKHFKVDANKIVKFLHTGMINIDELDDKIFTTNKNKGNENKEKRIKEEGKTKRFTPPTIDEVKGYFTEKGIAERTAANEAEKFINYYSDADWKRKGQKLTRWKGSASNWLKNINQYNNPQKNYSSDLYGVL